MADEKERTDIREGDPRAEARTFLEKRLKKLNPRRLAEIEDALRDVLQDGETFLVQKTGEDVHITVPAPRKIKYSPVKLLYPELYGCLLSADERITDASGCFTSCLFFLAAAGLCLALHLNLLDTRSNRAFLQELHSPWVYAFVVAVTSWLAFLVSEVRERLAYRRVRREVLDAIGASEISYLQLLAQIEGDRHVEKIGEYIKKDPRADVCRAKSPSS